MEKQYYIIKNGEKQGPFGLDQMRQLNIDRDTYVWYAGMQDWTKAGDLPELATLFGMPQEEESAFGAYARPEAPSPTSSSFNMQQPYPQPAVKHTNWLPWAIVGTVGGFLFSCIGAIFGIIGIINANKANKLYAMGDETGGKMNNSTARTMSIIALVLTGLGIIFTVCLFTSKMAGLFTGDIIMPIN